jgi:hypothetical protein
MENDETELEEVDGFMEEEGVYSYDMLQELLEDDEISSKEQSFMAGYIGEI